MPARLEAAMPFNTLVNRVRAEYLEMPGLRLTLEQAQRLCGIERALCKAVLDALVADQFLCMTMDGAYARSSEGISARPRAVKTDLGTDWRVTTAS